MNFAVANPAIFTPAELAIGFAGQTETQFETGEGSELEIAFVENQKWRRAREENQDYYHKTWQRELSELEKNYKKLEEVVKRFHSLLPDDLKDSVSARPKSTDFFRDVSDAMEKVARGWETRSEKDKFANARRYVRKVGSTMASHSNALKILPSSNDYASAFCGALTMFVKASSNYERLSEGFARAMEQINDSVTLVHQQVLAYKDDLRIQGLVVRLYSQIFAYLINTIKWYTDKWHKRLMRSLNENIYSQYHDQVLEIARLSQLITDTTTTLSRESLEACSITTSKDVKLLISLLKRDTQMQAMREEGYFEKLRADLRKDMREILLQDPSNVQQSIMNQFTAGFRQHIAGTTITRHIEQAAASNMINLNLIPMNTGNNTHTRLMAEDQALPGASINDNTYTKTNILLHSTHLIDSYNEEKLTPFFPSNEAPSFFIDSTITTRIWHFTSSPSSEILHIRGPVEMVEETQTARVAARYITATRNSGVRAVSYFCNLSRKEPPRRRTRETVELVALAYAVIRQLVEFLDAEAAPGEERCYGEKFGPGRFAALDGTLGSWGVAMGLLKDLFEVNEDPLLYIAIDGLNLLDDVSYHSTTVALREFVTLLRGFARPGGRRDKFIVKLLFTTAGESGALNEVLDGTDTFAVDF